MRSSRQKISEEDIARIERPVLVAVGTRDDIAGSPHKLAALMQHADVLEIPGRDHMVAVGDKVHKQGVHGVFEQRRRLTGGFTPACARRLGGDMSAKRIEFKGAEENALIADQYGTGGQPVILLHGGGQTRHSWAAAAERIAALGHVVYSVDQRGHGESAWVPSGNYMFVHFAQDLVALCRQVIAKHGAKPVVVGASLGGFAGMLAEGAEAPGNQAALVLVDITPRVDMDGVYKILGFMGDKVEEGLARLKRPLTPSPGICRTAQGRRICPAFRKICACMPTAGIAGIGTRRS
jgi:pimeloyl-ACP methyl ester carboxylesterase